MTLSSVSTFDPVPDAAPQGHTVGHRAGRQSVAAPSHTHWCPLAAFDSQGHRQMWYQLWRNRKLLSYLLKSKEVFVGGKHISLSCDASRVGRREILLAAIHSNTKGPSAWCPVQVPKRLIPKSVSE